MKIIPYSLMFLLLFGTSLSYAYEGEGELTEEELLAAHEALPESEYAEREPATNEIERQEAMKEIDPEETEWTFPEEEGEPQY